MRGSCKPPARRKTISPSPLGSARRTAVRRHRTNNSAACGYLEAVCHLMPSACRRHQTADGGYYIWEPTPWGEGARAWVQAAAPARLGGKAAFAPPDQTGRGYRLRPRVGQRGDCLLTIHLSAILLSVCSLFLSISLSSTEGAGTISHIYLYFFRYILHISC